jgi:polar amino acid transport system substrate-binding protein
MAIRARVLAATAAVLLLAGCSESAPSVSTPTVMLTPPTPAGMAEVPPERVSAPEADEDSCTASLRPFSTRADAQDAVRTIRNRGRLIVGLDIGSNLFSFRDPITGEITGFDVDIAGEVARDIFGTPSQVEYRILSSADRIAALESNQVDIVVKTMSITCERKERVNFSTEYLSVDQRILAPRDSPITSESDLPGKRVCAVKGTTSMAALYALDKQPELVGVSSWTDCLVMLQQGQVDAISTDDAVLAGLARQDPTVEIVGEPLGVEPYGIGVKRENADLVRFVNAVLDRMRADGTWERLYATHLESFGPSPGPPAPRYED